jgi:hypothetical protein
MKLRRAISASLLVAMGFLASELWSIWSAPVRAEVVVQLTNSTERGSARVFLTSSDAPDSPLSLTLEPGQTRHAGLFLRGEGGLDVVAEFEDGGVLLGRAGYVERGYVVRVMLGPDAISTSVRSY